MPNQSQHTELFKFKLFSMNYLEYLSQSGDVDLAARTRTAQVLPHGKAAENRNEPTHV
jgi:hypothetical protein